MKINLGGIIPLSTNEWKDHLSIVIFFNGCNFSCSYCHNQQMISAVNYIEIDYVKDEIRNSLSFIDSVVFTGGEPTLQSDPLEELLKFSKSLNLKTAIETNGYNFAILNNLYNKNLVDHLFIDIKTTEDNYEKITGKKDAYNNLKETIKVPIPHTLRTTVWKNIKSPKCSIFLSYLNVFSSPQPAQYLKEVGGSFLFIYYHQEVNMKVKVLKCYCIIQVKTLF